MAGKCAGDAAGVVGAAVEFRAVSLHVVDSLHPQVDPAGCESTCQAEDDGGIPPYRLGVNSGAAAAAGVSELQRARGRERAAYL